MNEKEAEVFKLHEQISSQQSSLEQRGINLHKKIILLSSLTGLIERLYEAEDKKEQQSLNLTLCKREADYHQKQAEELRSKVSTFVAILSIV